MIAQRELHRTRERAMLDTPTRIVLLEGDSDKAEWADLDLGAKLDRLNARVFSVLIGVLVALIALVANLIVVLVR
jgi:hypothetical protein